jgi:hypothetical protein
MLFAGLLTISQQALEANRLRSQSSALDDLLHEENHEKAWAGQKQELSPYEMLMKTDRLVRQWQSAEINVHVMST